MHDAALHLSPVASLDTGFFPRRSRAEEIAEAGRDAEVGAVSVSIIDSKRRLPQPPSISGPGSALCEKKFVRSPRLLCVADTLCMVIDMSIVCIPPRGSQRIGFHRIAVSGV